MKEIMKIENMDIGDHEASFQNESHTNLYKIKGITYAF